MRLNLIPYVHAVLICSLFSLPFASCKKNSLSPASEISQPSPIDDVSSFFTAFPTTDPQISSVRKFVYSQNQRYHFAAKFMEKIGRPIWSSSLVYGEGKQSAAGQGAGSSVVLVPFARSNEQFVNAVLIVKMKGTDTSFRMLYNWEYRRPLLGTGKPDTDFKGTTVFHIFGLLDRSVFGTSRFRITDPSLLPQSVTSAISNANLNSDSLNAHVTLKGPLPNHTARMIEVCETMEYCLEYKLKAFRQTLHASTSSGDPECLVWAYDVNCMTVILDDDFFPSWGSGGSGGGSGGSGGGSGGSGGGSGGSGGGSGGSDGGGWSNPDPNAPCDPSSVERVMETPCGGGWTPEDPQYNVYGYRYDRMQQLDELLAGDPFMLVDPCVQLYSFRQLGSYQAPQSVLDRISSLNQQFMNLYAPWMNMNAASDPYVIQNINDASSSVINMDFFPIHITQMPVIDGVPATSESLFDYFRKNMNSFIDNDIATFTPYADASLDLDDNIIWQSPNPVGTLLHLDMINDGTVIVSGYQSDPNDSKFVVSTIRTPLDGLHPVSGNRMWGIKLDATNGGYTFYTMAVDRVTNTVMSIANETGELLPVPSGFEMADKLWRSLQDKMISFITSRGGAAAKYSATPEITFRPMWALIEDFLRGNVSVEQLKGALGCP